MQFFIWENKLNTGIDIIDEQHQRIGSYINDLHVAIESHNKQLVGDTIIQLLDYTQSHLAFEEQLLDAADYPGLEAHKGTHRLFERRINRYFKHHFEGKEVAMPLISELKIWLTTHIQHEDMVYVPILKAYVDSIEYSTAANG